MTRILIVDDEPNNQRVLTYTLGKAGYETCVAANGAAALELITIRAGSRHSRCRHAGHGWHYPVEAHSCHP